MIVDLCMLTSTINYSNYIHLKVSPQLVEVERNGKETVGSKQLLVLMQGHQKCNN